MKDGLSVQAPGKHVPIASVTMFWIPLGEGQTVVRVSGKVFEALSAMLQHRRRCDLYHSALSVVVGGERFVIEMAPIRSRDGGRRGVVAEGPVGAGWAGRFRLFRYEIRCWRDGVIPDVNAATRSVMIDVDVATAERLVNLVASVPTPVWGRDELDVGEMWNSNSVTAWLLRRCGVDTDSMRPPCGGRAPGWDAGLAVASRPTDDPARAFLQPTAA